MNSIAPEILPLSSLTQTLPADTSSDSPFLWLRASSARFFDRDIPDFGAPLAESEAALNSDVIAPLADRSFICVRGADTDSFLQGQLSNDLRELTSHRAQLSSYSNPKGRVLALFLLFRRPDVVWLETQTSIAATTLKRLRMFVMRAKVVLDVAGTDMAALGIAGPNAVAILAAAALPTPEVMWGCAEAGEILVLRRPGADTARFSLHGSSAALAALWPQLSAHARPVGSAAWRLLDILAGLPSVHAETSEQHVAQMMNLDKLDGISFSKGCYPGQEIVARLHYLGSLKRRLFTGYAAAPDLKRGAPVFAADGSSMQPVGEVLDFAFHPVFGQALQLVLQMSHREAPLRVGSADGPVLRLIQA